MPHTIECQSPVVSLTWFEKAYQPQITIRSIIAGLFIGSIVLISNFQFGLQTGWVSMMSLPSALLGFAIFETLQNHLDYKFTDVENVFVQSVAVAVGTGPLAYGFVGIIPAIEKFMTIEESGLPNGVDLSPIWKLIVWSTGLAFFGVFFAIPLRKQVVVKEKLPFPSGSATASLISVFHGTEIFDDDEILKQKNDDSIDNNSTSSLRNSSITNLNQRSSKLNKQVSQNTQQQQQQQQQQKQKQQSLPSPYHDQQPQESDSTNTDHIINRLTCIESQDLYQLAKTETYRQNIKSLIITVSISSVYTILSYFIPQLRSLNIFGSYLSKNYLWNFQPSPAYIGQGMIMGLTTTSYMLFGTILGWAVLAPFAKYKNWAPGEIDDWKTGGQGWILWISLAVMISDSVVSFFVISLKSLFKISKKFIRNNYYNNNNNRKSSNKSSQDKYSEETDHNSPLLSNIDENSPGSDEEPSNSTYHGEQLTNETSDQPTILQPNNDVSNLSVTDISINSSESDDDDLIEVDQTHLISTKITVLGVIFSSILCIISIRLVFGEIIPLYTLAASIILALFLSILGVRALGETDLNPVSGIGKLSQLIFALIIPRDQPGAVLINLVAGGIAEAGAQQAGDLMQDLKTGHLLGASPKAQFIAQMIGTVYSIILSSIIYKVYTSVYEIPGKIFRIPTSVIWIDCARLVTGTGLPFMADKFSIYFGIIFGLISILKNTIPSYKNKSNNKIINFIKNYLIALPSGVAVGIGLYNIPSFTLARFLGGVISYFWLRKVNTSNSNDSSKNDNKIKLIIFSSGLVLGEGIFSILNMIFTNFNVPHF
ncbi:hypothetical protein B5S29_g4352 [[Candida] boidinii]|nr:hypothetical protein B5S29_g4352 [[Candida] boidinii]